MRRSLWTATFAIAFLFLLTQTSSPPPPAPRPAAPVDDDIKPGEDAHGRHHWQWLMLRDPVSGHIPAGIHRREHAFADRLPQRAPIESIGGLAPALAKVDGWTYRGPRNIGGRVRALAVDVADPTHRTLLAGAVSGGMWRTTDDGASWSLTTGASQLHSVSCVVQDTRAGHEDTWYYGTGEGHASSPSRGGDLYTGDGIYKSTDGGLTWDVLPATSTGVPQEVDNPFDYVWRMVIDPSNLVEDEVYAAVRGGIMRSLDGGATWSLVLGNTATPGKYSDIAITTTGVLYTTISSEGAVHGVFRSPDGVNWSDISPALIAGYGRITMAISPSYESGVYFLASDPAVSTNIQFWYYLYQAGDGTGAGGAWFDRTAPFKALPDPYDPDYGNTWHLWLQRGYDQLVSVNPTTDSHVIVGGVHLWRNTNGWTNGYSSTRVGGYFYENRSHHADLHKIVYQPGSSTVAYSASDGGVHKTYDTTAATVQWQSLNHGLNTTQFYTVALDRDLPNNDVIIGGTQDNGTLWTADADSETDWVETFCCDGAHCEVLDGSVDGDYLVSYYRANMYRIKLDGTGARTHTTVIKPVSGNTYLFINPFINDHADENVVYLASDHGVWRNTDVTAIPWDNFSETSINWQQLTSEPAGVAISALATNSQPGHALYYGTATGLLYRVDDVLNAPAGTIPVGLHGNAAFPTGAYVSGIAVHPDDDRRVLVTFGNYLVESIWYTDDAGATWTDVEGNLAGEDGPSVRCAGIMPTDDPDLWLVGTSTGLYSTTPEGGVPVVWTREAPDELGNVIVASLAMRFSDRKVVLGTHGRGVHSVIIPESSLSIDPPDDEQDLPGAGEMTRLLPNVPNPFNPETVIHFNLARKGRVRIDVFDLRGRRVARLLDESRGAGPGQVAWRGRDARGSGVPTGAYIVRLETKRQVDTRKIMLQK